MEYYLPPMLCEHANEVPRVCKCAENCSCKLTMCGNIQNVLSTIDKIDQKPSNPKDLIGTNKVPLNLIPGTTMAYLAIGHLEGDLKYGKRNWREAGVKFSIYLDACMRHLKKLDDGEWADKDTKVPHLANALCCLSIIVDAYECGKLIDDRPKSAPTSEVIDKMSEVVKHLRELHKDAKPTDYFITGPKERGTNFIITKDDILAGFDGQ